MSSFDLELTGFDPGEIDIILRDGEQTEARERPGPDRRYSGRRAASMKLWIVGPSCVSSAVIAVSIRPGERSWPSNLAQWSSPICPTTCGSLAMFQVLRTSASEFAMGIRSDEQARVHVLSQDRMCSSRRAVLRDGQHYDAWTGATCGEVLRRHRTVCIRAEDACVWAKTNPGTRAKHDREAQCAADFLFPGRKRVRRSGAIWMSSSLCWR